MAGNIDHLYYNPYSLEEDANHILSSLSVPGEEEDIFADHFLDSIPIFGADDVYHGVHEKLETNLNSGGPSSISTNANNNNNNLLTSSSGGGPGLNANATNNNPTRINSSSTATTSSSAASVVDQQSFFGNASSIPCMDSYFNDVVYNSSNFAANTPTSYSNYSGSSDVKSETCFRSASSSSGFPLYGGKLSENLETQGYKTALYGIFFFF